MTSSSLLITGNNVVNSVRFLAQQLFCLNIDLNISSRATGINFVLLDMLFFSVSCNGHSILIVSNSK